MERYAARSSSGTMLPPVLQTMWTERLSCSSVKRRQYARPASVPKTASSAA